MKIAICWLLVMFYAATGFTQIGIGTTSPDNSAALDIQSLNKGLLIPRMPATQRLSITSPANGLMVFDTDSSSLFIYSSAVWRKMASIRVLSDLITGTSVGDVLVWNGTQWVVIPKSNLFTYFFRDKDGDGYGDKYQPVMGTSPLSGFVADSTDCDDNNVAVNPTKTWYRDSDGDGFGVASQTMQSCSQPAGYVSNTTDCNDDNAAINPAAADFPDDGLADTNCDGMDGDEAAAIFVSPLGDDANAGTKEAPKKTITNALQNMGGKTQVYIAAGTYTEKVTLVNGVSLYGGYGTNWIRSATGNTVTVTGGSSSGAIIGIEGTSISLPTTIDRLRVQTANATSPGASNYAFYCVSCTGVTLSGSALIAGNGAVGASGVNGANGDAGGNGNNGTVGACDVNVSATGGNGGFSSCGRTGGKGGNGGYGAANGQIGASGVGGTSGGFSGSSGDPGGHGTNGANGVAGANGTNGGGGAGGSVVGNLWVTSAGMNGVIGAAGNGGGGGGGGGGQNSPWANDGTGNGGGGGGAGGCGGGAGSSGAGGGGSFGLFVVNSSGIQLLNNAITSGNGGAGGAGGAGGSGGNGGPGGAGGNLCTSEVGRGGNGGSGGKGGNGGHGGGGAGGPSYAIYKVSTTVTTTGNSLTAGSGGTGGSSPASPGSPGVSAISN